MYFYIK